jgi:acyl-CoA synthetase (AMP-forming)/AMP-acid ligase II/acyl carrier protein
MSASGAPSSLHDLVVGRSRDASIAVLAPGRRPLHYRELAHHVGAIGAWLAGEGMGASQRVAVALPNGPELGTAILGVASHAACVPIDFRRSEREIVESLTSARADLLIVPAGRAHVHRRAANAAGVRCVDVHWDDSMPAGCFTMGRRAATAVPNGGDAIALVLQTSGTTAAPKRVPLTHAQLCASAATVAATLALAPEDRCLDVMPLVHVHGLVGAFLASLHAGASVACVPEFIEGRFTQWLRDFSPTWYSAVPTIHLAILRELERAPCVSGTRLRFARSASSALPARLARALEAALGIPVIEAYGMTEAAHQIASNPLPPSSRVPGTVGIATGTDVAIMDATGNLLPLRAVGQVVIRGASVITRYDEAPAADERSFHRGWFLTGDLGWLDEEGRLRLCGRLKEIIDRGGVKVSPQEVEAVILEHESVAECAVFGVAHPTLGQDVVAAVVCGDAPVEARAVRDWLFDRVSPAKMPSHVVVVDELPKGSTGKLDRTNIAQRLAPRLGSGFAEPRGSVEARVAAMFSEVLGVERVGIHDNFFLLGGDSLRGGQLLARIGKHFAVALTLATLFKLPTPAQLAEAISCAARVCDEKWLSQLPRLEELSEDEAQALLRRSSSD